MFFEDPAGYRDDCTQKQCPLEVCDGKTGHKAARENHHEGIDRDRQEADETLAEGLKRPGFKCCSQPLRDEFGGTGKALDFGTNNRVRQPQYERHNDRSLDILNGNPRQDIGCSQDDSGDHEPVKEKTHNKITLNTVW